MSDRVACDLLVPEASRASGVAEAAGVAEVAGIGGAGEGDALPTWGVPGVPEASGVRAACAPPAGLAQSSRSTGALAELSASPVTTALVRVAGALADAELADPSAPVLGLSDEALLTAVRLAYQVEAQLQALQAHLVGELADRPSLRLRGATGLQGWLVGRQRVDPGKARGDAVLGRQLRGELLATGRALAAGEINRDHARAIHATIEGFPRTATDQHRSEAERRLLELARRRDPRVVRRAGRTILEEIDPELYDTVLRRQVERDEATAYQLRELTIRPVGDGRTRLAGTLTEPVAQALAAALDPLSAPLPSTADGPDPRSAGQRRHDGLAEMLRRYQASSEAPTHAGNGTEVVIRVTDTALFGRSGSSGWSGFSARPMPGPRAGSCPPADVDPRAGSHAAAGVDAGAGADAWPGRAARYVRDGSPLSSRAMAEALCDAKVGWIRFDSDYQGFWASPNPSRRFTGVLRRALELRYGGCAFPGCDRPVSWTIAHHIIPWSEGGPTVLNNGVSLCGSHHRTIHHTDWTVAMASDGLPVFQPPAVIDPERRPLRHQRYHPYSPDNPHVPASEMASEMASGAASDMGTCTCTCGGAGAGVGSRVPRPRREPSGDPVGPDP